MNEKFSLMFTISTYTYILCETEEFFTIMIKRKNIYLSRNQSKISMKIISYQEYYFLYNDIILLCVEREHLYDCESIGFKRKRILKRFKIVAQI